MKNSVSKLICLFTMCSLTLSISAQVESVRGPKKRTTTTTTTTVRQNQSSNQQRVSSGISTAQQVDLGLSVYWAGYNVGASSPDEYGSYFAWGETWPRNSYNKENSATYDKGLLWLRNHGYIDNNNILTLAHDAARSYMGGSWRMPTKAEFEELKSKCKWEWTTYGGKKGFKVTGPNGNAIFLPAAGWREGTSLDDAGKVGLYWSSSPNENYDGNAWYLFFVSAGQSIDECHYYYGHSVRPVADKY